MKYRVTQDELYKWANIQSTIEIEVDEKEIDELIKNGDFDTREEAIISLADTQGTTIKQKILSLEKYESSSNKSIEKI